MLENLKDNAVRFLLMTMKNTKTCLDKGTQIIRRFKVPMCFKGDDGATNDFFHLQQIREPYVEESNKYTKMCSVLQMDELYKKHFRGCKHWIAYRAHSHSILSLINDFDVTPILSRNGLNDLRLPLALES